MKHSHLKTIVLLSPFFFLLHNLEESLTMVQFVHANLQHLPQPFRWLEETLQLTQPGFIVPVAILTGLMFALSFWIATQNGPRWAQMAWSIAMLTLCANAFTHILQGIWFLGYTPGLISAVALQLPITILAAVASVRAGWLSRAGAVAGFLAGFPLSVLLSIAFLFLGKGLIALFA